jgi:hypothetical protein
MVTVNTRDVLQRASQRSARVRTAGSALRHELAHGATPPADAVHDPRAGVLTAYSLAVAVPGVGSHIARHVCGRLCIPETKRIRELTPRQKDRLAVLLQVVGR